MEIVAEQGPFLVVPNEAIIEEGDTHIVYVQQGGEYVPKEVTTGIQGELYTQVLGGLEPNAQVVTFGSFFIDAEHKLKGTGRPVIAALHQGRDPVASHRLGAGRGRHCPQRVLDSHRVARRDSRYL